MRVLDTDKYLYQLVGGLYNGNMFRYAGLEARDLIAGYSQDMSQIRATGTVCKRAELDNQPIVKGYLGPMYGGVMYFVNGKLKYDFMCDEDEKQGERFIIIRYETQKAYDMLSQ